MTRDSSMKKIGKTKEQIKVEWESLDMEPRIQSPDEMRRVLMTWTKDQIITFMIRAESDEIRARHKMLNAWDDANRLREYALVLPRETKKHEMGHADPFNAWLLNHKGQTLDAREVFKAGYVTANREREATDQ